jgi:hypothetical protein
MRQGIAVSASSSAPDRATSAPAQFDGVGMMQQLGAIPA